MAKQKGPDERSFMRLERALNESARNLMGFTQALLPLPTSMASLVKQSQQVSGSGGSLSTLGKSLQLVMMQLGNVFLPMIVRVSKGLQDFSNWLEKMSEEPVGDEMTRLGRATKEGDIGAGAKAYAEALAKGILQGVPNMMRLGTANPFFDRDAMARRLAGPETKGVSEDEFQMARLLRDTAGPLRMAGDLMRQSRQMAGTGPVFRMFNQLQAEAARRPAGGRMTSQEGRGRGLLTDALPPGYHARFQGFEEARRQMQISALQTTPLDVEINRLSLKALQRLVQMAEEDRKAENPIPQQTTRR